MKNKLIFLFTIFVLISNMNAQSFLNAGSYTISGSIDYSSQTTYYAHESPSVMKIINVSPSGSYFILDKISVGLQISYNYQDYNTIYNKQHIYVGKLRIGPLFRYYFIDDRFAPFIELEYSHDIYNLPSDRNVDYLGYSIGFGIGLNYFMTKYFALEPYINYQYSLNKYWDYNYDEIPTGSYYYHIEATSIGFRLNYFIK